VRENIRKKRFGVGEKGGKKKGDGHKMTKLEGKKKRREK